MKKIIGSAFVVILFTILASCVAGFAEGNAKSGEELKVGDSFFFGACEQDYDHKDDNLLLNIEPIEWVVIRKTSDKALLLSKYVIDCEPYNTERENITWQNSSIREYLNGSFMDYCFSNSEKAAIIKPRIQNSGEENGDWSSGGGNSTEDFLFLLSYKEVNSSISYLRSEKNRKTTATTFAAKLGADEPLGKNVCWWLRSPGKKQNEACYVDGNGAFGQTNVNSKSYGIRPALWLDLNADFSTFDYELYERAREAFDAREYEDALESVAHILHHGYRDWFRLWFESITRMCLSDCGGQEDYQDYILNDFMRFSDDGEGLETYLHFINITDSCYESAKDCMSLGNYGQAINLLTYIGIYKDSMDLLRECFDQSHMQWSFLTNRIGSTVNAGLDTGYTGTKEILDGDPHFGWPLGRFMISGYTEREDNVNMPVFYKTPGDNLVLWFDLEQDIDALNRNADLFIEDDVNGYDQQFQIPKSDFGRGALFVQHTDARNQDSAPQTYFNFLAASDTTGANTRVEINEEGVYRVALDYEIGQKGKILVVDKTDHNDYRIYFTFEVRNGSNTFFLFDLLTGSVLDDYMTTENGFRIELLESQSLSVDYTRYVINQSATALDPRKDTLTTSYAELNKIGYYEITVTNKKTDKKLTKHIFVGSTDVLELYKKVDPVAMAKFG